ncbi:hypothetical protein SCUCBS95973_004115 [Sporothrix curviconia]|uniref:RING-type domain-containing protein n=1 Tax=Sporothrix curviconia TaxID=1260050 RepID=A0ABP0BL22_9PEZI
MSNDLRQRLASLHHALASSLFHTTRRLTQKAAGASNADAKDNDKHPALADFVSHVNAAGIDGVKDEDDPAVSPFLLYTVAQRVMNAEVVQNNLQCRAISRPRQLASIVAARTPPLSDLADRYRADAAYRDLVIANLTKIIDTDVTAIAVNLVFGSLWRTVCPDRTNPARERLIEQFGRRVDEIDDPARKERLKKWLENSYNFAAEIAALIDAVPAADQFPCVFLDPTLEFKAEEDVAGDEAEPTEALSSFTRAELLEIGRSCDPRILRRLGRVLTRLTYVATEADLPAHIRHSGVGVDGNGNASAGRKKSKTPGVPRILLALARPEHNRQFWRVLLHTVLPGTKLSQRPAALLAALSLRMGMAPLRPAADAELLACRDSWATLDIHETWNVNCLSLLLAADKDYRHRQRQAAVDAADADDASSFPGLLPAADCRLFSALVDYKLLEMNLDTTLESARVGWRPDKTRVAMGPVVTCSDCSLPRSVTMMAPGGVCGLCNSVRASEAEARKTGPMPAALHTTLSHDELVARTRANVSATDDAATPACWVECSVRSCRAQYVVYNPDALRVRPKCYYCRRDGRGMSGPLSAAASAASAKPLTTPLVECVRCLSRIIWPEEYRPTGSCGGDGGVDPNTYTCPACASGSIETVVAEPTTARALAAENGTAWLLRNTGGKIAKPLSGHSVFNLASTAGIEGFADAVEVLPGSTPPALRLTDKKVHNADDVVAELRRWIASRRAGTETCSLCFSTVSASRGGGLRRACFRRGCHQRICLACARAWYGLNGRGRIINIAALSCPFCRRQPAASALGGSNAPGLDVLANLRKAMQEAGTWIYAWCFDCGEAKPFIERQCARGAPPEVQRWQCAECQEAAAAAAVRVAVGLALTTGMRAAPQRVRPCPGCGVETWKAAGCDHITCTVPGCGTHWCFGCGKAVSEAAIYKHMDDEHGTWGMVYHPPVSSDDETDDEDLY